MKTVKTFARQLSFSLMMAMTLGSAIVSCGSILDEEDVDCSVEYRVKFKYDYNMKYADAFSREVGTVTLYAFDDNGKLVYQKTEEGDVDCIGIFDVDVKRFLPQKHEDKVPAMGWNEIYDLKTDLYKGFGNRMDSDSDKSTADALLHPYSYFVHSYYVPLCEETIAKAEYILPYSASLHKDNFYTCQFHPEKSGKVGERILKNFLEIK